MPRSNPNERRFLRWAIYACTSACLLPGSATGQCSLAGGVGAIGAIFSTSGNGLLDQKMSQELYQISAVFGLRPGFKFFDDAQGPNAFATPRVLVPDYPDGTVLFGMRLLREQLAQSAMQGYSIPAIAAHEFGHILQFHRNQTPTTTMGKELQADFLAGWYMGRRLGIFPENTDLQEVMATFYSKGSYEFNDPNFHGTPQQRLDALKEGIAGKSMSLGGVYMASLKYVEGDGEKPPLDSQLTCEVTDEEISHADIPSTYLSGLHYKSADLVIKVGKTAQAELRKDIDSCQGVLNQARNHPADAYWRKELQKKKEEIAEMHAAIRALKRHLDEIQ